MIVKFRKPLPTRKQLQEMISWCDQTVGEGYTYSTGHIFWFREDRYATMFLLKFGGYT